MVSKIRPTPLWKELRWLIWIGCSIQPTDVCINLSGGVVKYDRRIYGQHLLSKVKKNFHSGTGVPDIPPAMHEVRQTLVVAGV